MGPSAQQQDFDAAVRQACTLTHPDWLLQYATEEVECLSLTRALPHTHNLQALLGRLHNIKVRVSSWYISF